MALFDKLAANRGPRTRRAELDGIIRNLENVLNSRREYSASLLPDFGIRTLTEHGSREAIAAAVMADVSECIAVYEPRLRLDDIEMDAQAGPLKLSFTLRCTLRDDPHELQISFDTVLNSCNVARR